MSEAFTEKFISTRTLALESKDFSPPDEGQAAIARRGDLEGTLLRGDDLEEGAGLRDERIDLQDDSGAIKP